MWLHNVFTLLMLQASNIPLHDIWVAFYPEFKFWGMMGGILWTIYKGVAWVKEIKTNDLQHINQGIMDMENGMKEQTKAIVDELKEIRSDFRALMTALIK